MSSFLNQGNRVAKVLEKKKVKRHIKEFYKTLSKLDVVANELKELDIEVTEDNIEVEASKVLGRNIDSMEKFLLLGKLSIYEVENNIK